ncbi:MAG: sulfatase-like hydrolase/transferase [Clostridia bacterium]|nr:sulfatase-like hydrolase/transferase [Clostridia bacterium]
MTKKISLERIYYYISPLITVFLLDILRFGGNSPLSFNTPLQLLMNTALSFLFISALQIFLGNLFKKQIISFYTINLFFFIMAIVCRIKIRITSDPLLPANLLLAGKLEDIVSFIKVPVDRYMVISAIILVAHLIVYTYLYKKSDRLRFSVPKTLGSFVLCVTVLYCFCFNYSFRHELLPKLGVPLSNFYIINDYNKNGLILTFFTRIGDLRVAPYQNYNQETMSNILFANNDIEEYYPVEEETEKINIIAIQSESLWDPTLMPNITLSADPLANIHRLGKTFPAGQVVSPSYGCNTCIPEFEFLTGFSSAFLPVGSYPYSQYILKPTISLASICQSEGYSTTALHTYDKKFYNRDTAYDLMGFEEFYGDKDFENPEKKGIYISDMELTRQIIKTFEEKEEEPIFIYAISMQNHGNYLEKRYDSYDIDVTSDAVTDEELAGLKDAVQGIYDIDQSFYTLTEYFKNVGEPTLITIYGDHLPFLGIDSSTYIHTGFFSGELSENPAMFETPYIVWANFPLDKTIYPKRISPANLGLKTLMTANLTNIPWYSKLFNKIYANYTVIHPYFACDENGDYIGKPDFLNNPLLKQYKYTQYDYLHGKKLIDATLS